MTVTISKVPAGDSPVHISVAYWWNDCLHKLHISIQVFVIFLHIFCLVFSMLFEV